MDFNFLKNPIILAILAGILTYIYMWWDNKKKKEKNPKATIEEIDYIPPAMVALLTLFVSYNLFGNGDGILPSTQEIVANSLPKDLNGQNGPNLQGGKMIQNRFSDKLAESFDSHTYHLLGKNTIKLPQTDVFIDIVKF